MESEAYTVLTQLYTATKVYRRAYEQVTLLEDKIKAAETRFRTAMLDHDQSFMKTNRKTLVSQTNLRNLAFEYAVTKCEEVKTLQNKLLELKRGDTDEFIKANIPLIEAQYEKTKKNHE